MTAKVATPPTPAAPHTGRVTDLASLARTAPAPFAGERLTSYAQALEQTLLTDRVKVQRCARIDLSQVRGVSHPAAAGRCRPQLLTRRRAAQNLVALRDNPDYYLSEEPKDIFVTALGDDLYISGGVHRTVIARFFRHYNRGVPTGGAWLSGVRLEQGEVDTEAQSLTDKVRTLFAEHNHLADSLRRLCEEGRDHFLLCNRRTGWHRQFAKGESPELAHILARPQRAGRFGRGRLWNVQLTLPRV